MKLSVFYHYLHVLKFLNPILHIIYHTYQRLGSYNMVYYIDIARARVSDGYYATFKHRTLLYRGNKNVDERTAIIII